MKPIFILLLFLLLCSIPAHSQSRIKIGGTFELGYENRELRIFDDNINTTYQTLWLANKEFADIHLNAGYKGLSVYTNVKTYFKPKAVFSHDLSQIEYKLGINYQIKSFLFNIEHMRSNSIQSQIVHEMYDKISVKINLWDPQAYTQIKTAATIELGYENRILRIFDDNVNAEYQSSWLKDKLFVDVCLNANYKRLFIYTGIKTYINYEKFYRYDPFQAAYKIGISYEVDKSKRVLLNAEHMCSHSIKFDSFYEFYDRFIIRIIFGNK